MDIEDILRKIEDEKEKRNGASLAIFKLKDTRSEKTSTDDEIKIEMRHLVNPKTEWKTIHFEKGDMIPNTDVVESITFE